MEDSKQSLDRIIISVEKVLEKYKNKEDLKEAYQRIKTLGEKRNIKRD